MSESSGRSRSFCWHGKPKSMLCMLQIAKAVSPTEFDLMRKRGFLRMGTTLMCHDNLNTCCGQFQFRVDVRNFKLNKRQRKLMRRWQDFLDGKEQKEGQLPHKASKMQPPGSPNSMMEEEPPIKESEKLFEANLKTFTSSLTGEGFPKWTNADKSKVFPDKQSPKEILVSNTLQILFQDVKDKDTKLEEFIQEVRASKAFATLEEQSKQLGLEIDKKGFIRLGKTTAPFVSKEAEIKEKKAKTQKPDLKTVEMQQPSTGKKHKFEIKMEEPGYRPDKQAVVSAYQQGGLGFGIPGGVRGAGSFKGVSSTTKQNGDHVLELGSKHMCYYLDDKLVGLGVVDLTDTMLCSLFFVYDPILKPFSFGILSVLFEIEYVANKHKHFPEFAFQNLGAYELENQKMEYKTNFRPAELLCPFSMKFVDFDERVQKCLESRNSKLCGDMVAARDQTQEFLSPAEIKPFLKANVSIEIQGKLQKCSDLPEAVLDKVAVHYEGVFVALGKTLTRTLRFRVGGHSSSNDSDDED